MYNDNKKKVVEPRSFPDHLAPDEVKKSLV